MMNMTTVRNIQNGKSASFPVTGKIQQNIIQQEMERWLNC